MQSVLLMLVQSHQCDGRVYRFHGCFEPYRHGQHSGVHDVDSIECVGVANKLRCLHIL